MKRLILGTIPDDFQPKRDIPLGPWCFLGRENVYPGWESLQFEPDPFSTPESLHEASQKTCAYANSLVPLLVPKLNHQNDVFYSNRFWRLMLLPWLISLVQTTWFNLCCIERFIKKHKGERFEVELMPNSIEWKFKDTLDFLYKGALNPIFENWLYSKIIAGICPDNWVIVYKEKQLEQDKDIKEKISWMRLLYEKMFFNRRCKGVYGIGFIGSLVWSIFLSMKPSVGLEESNDDVTNSYSDNEIKWPFDFLQIVNETMPVCFKNLNINTKRRYKTKKGKIHLIGPLLYYNENDKFRYGIAVENWEKLICTQHGGMYGIAKTYPYPSEIEYKQYSFLSWGWAKQVDYRGNIQALPSPYLSKYHNKHKQKTSNLIMVCTSALLYPMRLQSSPQPVQKLRYRANKVQFLEALDNRIFNETLYRPFFDDRGALKERPFLEKIFPTLQYCVGKLHPQILKCKLLVMDNPDTTLNIALAANIPTIGFWDKQSWAMAKQAIPFFDTLENAGILFQKGQDAAKKINEIWDDVESWWSQELVQKARKNWCYQYARTSKFWWWEWIKELWRV